MYVCCHSFDRAVEADVESWLSLEGAASLCRAQAAVGVAVLTIATKMMMLHIACSVQQRLHHPAPICSSVAESATPTWARIQTED